MPFYIRKSVSAGPFRFNFSKGGVGVSVGVRGLRVGSGPRGHYIHAGRGGVYYRATLGHTGRHKQPAPRPAPSALQRPSVASLGNIEMVPVEAGDVEEMRDLAFEDLLAEINAKQRQMRLSTAFAVGASAIGALAGLLAGVGGLVVLVLALPAWKVGQWFDSYRRAAVLFYDLDEAGERAYRDFVQSFDGMMGCSSKWRVEADGAVRDLTTWKRNAGASRLIQRAPTKLAYGLPLVVKCNLTPPAIHLGRRIIYFLPDVALIEEHERFGVIGYSDLKIGWKHERFIEDGRVPPDAKIVDHTWKHPNKDGGPDRRFNNNRQLPVCCYEIMHVGSASGMNALVQLSRLGVTEPFWKAMRSLPKGGANPTKSPS